MNYLLPCTACGSKIPVSTGQAGQSLHCTCGAELEVPSIRELRNLEGAVDESANAPTWSRRQGFVFLGGASILMVSVGIAVLWLLRPALVDVSREIRIDDAAIRKEIQSVSPDENYMRTESVRPWPPTLFAKKYKEQEIPVYLLPSAELISAFELGGTQYLAPGQARPIMEKAQVATYRNIQTMQRWKLLGEWMVYLGVAGGLILAVSIAGALMRSEKSRKPPTRQPPTRRGSASPN